MTIKQRQSLGKIWEEQTKAAFACCEHEAQCNESSADVHIHTLHLAPIPHFTDHTELNCTASWK